MKKLVMVILLSGFAGALSACHTVKGVGEDVSAAGRTVQKASKVGTPNP